MQAPEQPDLTIDAATRKEVIDTLLKRLNESYVFPETAAKMEQAVRARLEKKEYDQITSAKEFARKLTEDVQAVTFGKPTSSRNRSRTSAARVTAPSLSTRRRRDASGRCRAPPASSR